MQSNPLTIPRKSGISIEQILPIVESATDAARAGLRFKATMKLFRVAFLEEILAMHKGNHSAAARFLGIHRNTFNNHIK